jgi:hypothetical protein
VRTAFDGPTDTPSMIFWTARCRINSEAAALAATVRTPKRSENVGAPTCFGKSPSTLRGIFNRFADVLIRVLCHAPAHPPRLRSSFVTTLSYSSRASPDKFRRKRHSSTNSRDGAANAIPVATTVRKASRPALGVALSKLRVAIRPMLRFGNRRSARSNSPSKFVPHPRVVQSLPPRTPTCHPAAG